MSRATASGQAWPLGCMWFAAATVMSGDETGVSFLNIGIVWVNHHSIFSRLRVDHGSSCSTCCCCWSFRSYFPTRVLGDALQGGDFADQRTAALLYAGNFLFASAAFCALWLWASRGRRLIRDEMCDEAIRLRTWRMAIAIPAFSIPFVVAIWSPISAVAIDGAIMISFLLSDGWLERRISTLNGAVVRRLK